MLIDWFTVGAQALNFLILVWLLKRFLHKPILNAIDAREKRVASELADADAKRAEAKRERDEFHKRNEEFDQSRAALLAKAAEEAGAERLRLLGAARKAADALEATRRKAMRDEARNLGLAIRRMAQAEVFAIARKALADLADESLEDRMVSVFKRRLGGMEAQAKATLAEAVKTSSEPALFRGAFDFPEDRRAAIRDALNESFSADIPLRFETEPELLGGFELVCNGQKLGWNFAGHLATLEDGVGELLEAKASPQAGPGGNEPSATPPETGQ